jgi:hypothetical protein
MRKVVVGLLVSAVAFSATYGFASRPEAAKPARYLYVWTGTGHHDATGPAMVAVFDADPSSANYGKLVNVVTVDSAASMPHHTELAPPANATSFFANDFGADRSWVIDFSDPPNPRVVGRVGKVAGGRMMHSFARLPNGNVLATIQFGDKTVEGDPGMLAEFDRNGRLLKSASSADKSVPGGRIRTYGITALPAIDRVVTTSSPMDNEVAADVVQVWRLSDLSLLKTLTVPQLAGDSVHRYPFELRTMADGKTAFLNSYYCGLYRLIDLDSSPEIEHIGKIADIGCAVPHVAGNLMVMPIAYGHKVVTLDISNPAKPREVASLTTDKTFYPHWVSGDPTSDRLVMTDQGDGSPRIMIANLDRATGKLTWDEKFRDAGSDKPGVSLENVSWPNGVKGKVMAHGALFIQ